MTVRFEKTRTKNDDYFDEFYDKSNDVVNSSFSLGEQIPSKAKIARKVMKSLPERRLKVTAIEESKDLDLLR